MQRLSGQTFRSEPQFLLFRLVNGMPFGLVRLFRMIFIINSSYLAALNLALVADSPKQWELLIDALHLYRLDVQKC